MVASGDLLGDVPRKNDAGIRLCFHELVGGDDLLERAGDEAVLFMRADVSDPAHAPVSAPLPHGCDSG